MAESLLDIDSDQWVFVVGWLGFKHPMGVFGSDEEIYDLIAKRPNYIFFLGPKSLSDVRWRTSSLDT